MMSDNTHITVISIENGICKDVKGMEQALTPKILKYFQHLAASRGLHDYKLIVQAISDSGENSFGQILQVSLINVTINDDNLQNNKNVNYNHEIEARTEFCCIVKISPKNPKRRIFMRVVDFYAKEVFAYCHIFNEYYTLYEERLRELNAMVQTTNSNIMTTIATNESIYNIIPQVYYSCLDLNDEFLVLEDLSKTGYKMNSRMRAPNYDLVIEAFRAIAHMHAMSFVLQMQKPNKFATLVPNLKEHLFHDNMPAPTEQFAKRYLKRARLLFDKCCESSSQHSTLYMQVLIKMENNFKKILVDCVKPDNAVPYAVISHGDFWNNNILYKYDDNGKAISAKLIDFQICRYSAPVLDLVHYLFTCTEKDLRDNHFWEFMNCYYASLERNLQFYNLSINAIYPHHIFLQQLKDYGIYGFCMAVFSLPFFISTKKEMLDFDKVAEAVDTNTLSQSSSLSALPSSSQLSSPASFKLLEINDDESSTGKRNANNGTNANLKVKEAEKFSELWKEYDMLNERTIPIFKKRILGILEDVIQYNMIDNIMKLE